MELLKQLEDHKKFLFAIFKKKDPVWAQEQDEKRRHKIERIKRAWVDRFEANPELYEDEDKYASEMVGIGGNVGGAGKNPEGSSFGGGYGAGGSRYGRGKGSQQTRPKKDRKYFEERFDLHYEHDDIDVESDHYDEEILFGNDQPEQLMNIFEE